VKHRAKAPIDIILSRLAVEVPPERVSLAINIAKWIAPASAKLGLTRHADLDSFVENLVQPALFLLPHIPSSATNIGEVGPGSGAAGLTLAALRPDLDVHLIDRRARVCSFLDIAANRFALTNCHISWWDFVHPPDNIVPFDLLTARAVAPMGELLASLPALVAVAGRICLFHNISDLPGPPPDLTRIANDVTNLPTLQLAVYEKLR